MVIGQYTGRIDEKYRIAFPKKFREAFGDTLILTKGLEGHLIIVSEKNWRVILEGTEGKPFTDKNTRETQRFLLGNASEIVLDEKGRFILPDYLREYAHITEDIVFLGIERFVEVWDKTQWTEHQENLAQNIVGIAERLRDNERNG